MVGPSAEEYSGTSCGSPAGAPTRSSPDWWSRNIGLRLDRRFGSTSSRRCAVRFTSAAPTRSFLAGAGLSSTLLRAGERIGVDVLYDAAVTALKIRARPRPSRHVLHKDAAPRGPEGGSAGLRRFQANLEWLRESWGPAADNFIVRGTPLRQRPHAAGDARQGSEAHR